jgi:hypothetical protein
VRPSLIVRQTKWMKAEQGKLYAAGLTASLWL